jgi:TniQ
VRQATTWPRGPTAPLPRTVTPFAAETVQSYLDRLAHANHLTPGILRRYLSETRRHGELHVEWLATATGQPRTALEARLVGLHGKDSDATRQRRHGRPACRLCMARRQVHQPVYCWYPNHHTVCHHHRRWIGPFAHTLDDQRDLSAAPDVVAAATLHLHLHRRNGDTTRYVLREAQRILRWWSTAETGKPSHPAADVDSYIAAYPDLIDLAAILADSHRQILNTPPATANRARASDDLYTRLIKRFPDRVEHSRAIEQWLHDHHLINGRRLRHDHRGADDLPG